MLVVVGKASPNDQRGDVEFYLREFETTLRSQGRFAYAWTFNPDANAIGAVRDALGRAEGVFLYLPHDGSHARVRMRIVDFAHEPGSQGMTCPTQWTPFCIHELRGLSSFSPSAPIHLWFLIDEVEHLPVAVDVRAAFKPVFPTKYMTWGQNFFAFLRG